MELAAHATTGHAMHQIVSFEGIKY